MSATTLRLHAVSGGLSRTGFDQHGEVWKEFGVEPGTRRDAVCHGCGSEVEEGWQRGMTVRCKECTFLSS